MGALPASGTGAWAACSELKRTGGGLEGRQSRARLAAGREKRAETSWATSMQRRGQEGHRHADKRPRGENYQLCRCH